MFAGNQNEIETVSTKHTPGLLEAIEAWEIVDCPDCDGSGKANRHDACRRCGGIGEEVRGILPEDVRLVKANAHLIATAPELFDNSKLILDFLENGTPIHPGSLLHGDLKNILAKLSSVTA